MIIKTGFFSALTLSDESCSLCLHRSHSGVQLGCAIVLCGRIGRSGFYDVNRPPPCSSAPPYTCNSTGPGIRLIRIAASDMHSCVHMLLHVLHHAFSDRLNPTWTTRKRKIRSRIYISRQVKIHYHIAALVFVEYYLSFLVIGKNSF